MALLGGVSGLCGVLLAEPLGLGPLGPGVFFGVLIASYLWTKEVWWMPRLAGVVAASIGGSLIAGIVGVFSGFLLPIVLDFSLPTLRDSSASDSFHSLALAPGGLVQAGLLSSVTLTSWPKGQAGVMRKIAGCTIAGAFLSVIGAIVAAPLLWNVEPIAVNVIWQAGMALVLTLAVEQRTAAAPSSPE